MRERLHNIYDELVLSFAGCIWMMNFILTTNISCESWMPWAYYFGVFQYTTIRHLYTSIVCSCETFKRILIISTVEWFTFKELAWRKIDVSISILIFYILSKEQPIFRYITWLDVVIVQNVYVCVFLFLSYGIIFSLKIYKTIIQSNYLHCHSDMYQKYLFITSICPVDNFRKRKKRKKKIQIHGNMNLKRTQRDEK